MGPNRCQTSRRTKNPSRRPVPISRAEFKQRWSHPVHRALKGFRVRAFVHVLASHAGATITAWATVVALGGGLVAVGLVEVAGTHPALSPIDNDWVLAGLSLATLGVLAALGKCSFWFNDA
jgi:uncharacterized protein (DUF2236 family)